MSIFVFICKRIGMSEKVPVFQYEVRYDHILNFSQIAREILAPYVKLSQSFKIDNQDTIEERIILNFDDDNYQIIAAWDRLVIRGQNNLNPFLSKNSPFEMPFMAVLEKLKELDAFGSIKNVLYAAVYIKKLDISKDHLFDTFKNKYLNSEVATILDSANDLAVTLEDRGDKHETNVTFGPYVGTPDLARLAFKPINLDNLDKTDYAGIMMIYKHGFATGNVTFQDFKELTEKSNSTFRKIWK